MPDSSPPSFLKGTAPYVLSRIQNYQAAFGSTKAKYEAELERLAGGPPKGFIEGTVDTPTSNTPSQPSTYTGPKGLQSLEGLKGITVMDVPSQRFTDGRLLQDLQTALAATNCTVVITDALREQHSTVGAEHSRHKSGRALDIGVVNGEIARLQNTSAMRLVNWFLQHGYRGGSEVPGQPTVLFGPVGSALNQTPFNHHTHIHISVPE